VALLTPSVIPIVALDVPDRAGAEAVVHRLGDACGFYKVGLELFSAEGPSIVAWLRELGKEVFVDLKLHDIPNTAPRSLRSMPAADAR
jgi:orotidine-5'-phosphate decarboxylase